MYMTNQSTVDKLIEMRLTVSVKPYAYEQTFDPVGSSPAEQEQRTFLKRITSICSADNLHQAFNTIAKVYHATGKNNFFDHCYLLKHVMPPW